MNINDHNNKGLLAIKLRKALKAKGLMNKDIEDRTGLAKSTVGAILRGADTYSMDSYKKVAEYLGVDIKPKKSLMTGGTLKTPSLVHFDGTDGFKKLTKEDIVQKERDIMVPRGKEWWDAEKEMQDEMERQFCGNTESASEEESALTVRWKKGTSFPYECFGHAPSVTLPAPIVQNEWSKFQYGILIGLNILILLFLIFPAK